MPRKVVSVCSSSPRVIFTRSKALKTKVKPKNNNSKTSKVKKEPKTRNSTMPGDIVKHSVITTVAEIPKFSGEPDSIDLSQYVKRINTLITNKGITEESLKIECFKEHIDAIKGTARHVITYSHLDNKKTLDEYIKAFKKHFTTKGDRDPLRAMVKFLNTAPETNESKTAFISRLDSQAKDIEEVFTNSDWVDKDTPTKISLKSMALVMMLAQVVKSNKGIVQERLYKDIKHDTPLGEVDCLLKGYAELDDSCSQHVLAARPTATQRHSRTPSRANYSTPNRGRSPSMHRQYLECYNCNKLGHSARNCYAGATCSNCQFKGHIESVCRNASWCAYHKMVGHRTVDCRARNQNFRGQRDENNAT